MFRAHKRDGSEWSPRPGGFRREPQAFLPLRNGETVALGGDVSCPEPRASEQAPDIQTLGSWGGLEEQPGQSRELRRNQNPGHTQTHRTESHMVTRLPVTWWLSPGSGHCTPALPLESTACHCEHRQCTSMLQNLKLQDFQMPRQSPGIHPQSGGAFVWAMPC